MTKAMAEKVLRLIEIYDTIHETTEEACQELEQAMDAGKRRDEWEAMEEKWDTCYSFEAAALRNAVTGLILCTKNQIDRPTARQMITDHREELEKILRKAV